jgi:hypothetical protein
MEDRATAAILEFIALAIGDLYGLLTVSRETVLHNFNVHEMFNAHGQHGRICLNCVALVYSFMHTTPTNMEIWEWISLKENN